MSILNEFEIDILRNLREHGEIMLDHMDQSSLSVYWGLEEKYLIQFTDRSIAPNKYPRTFASITPLGIRYLESAEREEQEQAEARRKLEEDQARADKEKRKDRHHDYFVAAFGSLFSFTLGVILQYYCDIVAFLNHAFDRISSLFH